MGATIKQIKIFNSSFDLYTELFMMAERGQIVERRFFIHQLTQSITRYFDIIRWLSKFFDVNAYKDKILTEGKVGIGIFIVGHRERVEIFSMLLGQTIVSIEKDAKGDPNKKMKLCYKVLVCLDQAQKIKDNLPIPYVANKKHQADINHYAKMYVRSISLKKKFRANYGNRQIAHLS